MILAAGRGTRMRPLTDTTPKPLLRVGGRMLIERHLERLAAIGIDEVVINTSHLAGQFPAALGDGARWSLRIRYSEEGPQPLDSGGGIAHALPLLGAGAFIAVNGDVWTDFDFSTLRPAPETLAHLVLIDNPPHHPRGDFGIDAAGRLHARPDSPPVGALRALTFSGIGVYRPELFADWRRHVGDQSGADAMPPRFSIVPLLRALMPAGQVTWQRHAGEWGDIGTPERLAELDRALQTRH
ncbi:MAG: N-acetylmuramate alpha-1-phosphate uridylyltransferase MurU [Lysobacterales bacterium]